jgi:hypothetical protein
VLPLARLEVAADQPVQLAQQVQVECRGDAESIVVGLLQHVVRLHEVDADQQPASRRAFAHAAQESERLVGREVADARARVEKHRPPVDQAVRQIECTREVESDADHRQRRLLALHPLQCIAQELDRDVDGDVARGLEQRKQLRRLHAAAGAEVDERQPAGASGADRTRHCRAVAREDRCFGAGRVVLRQFGDRFEQMRPEAVIEVLGCCAGGLAQQRSPGGFAVVDRIGDRTLDEAGAAVVGHVGSPGVWSKSRASTLHRYRRECRT